MQILFLVFMFIIGTCLGSFACCTARRLHAREKSPASRRSPYGHRSICDHCHRQLKWYENIPIFSWLFLKGRCKKCQTKIGLAEPLSELGLGLAFLALGLKIWPSLAPIFDQPSPAFNLLPVLSFFILICLFTALAICFIYDALWGSLPTFILYLGIALGAIYLAIEYISGVKIELWSLLAGIGILPGLYYLLYFFSRERLVGSGDWLLCLPLALVLHNFWLCFFVLFLANLLATIIELPLTLINKKRSHQFSFGPFLILAFLVIFLLQETLLKITWN